MGKGNRFRELVASNAGAAALVKGEGRKVSFVSAMPCHVMPLSPVRNSKYSMKHSDRSAASDWTVPSYMQVLQYVFPLDQ